MAKMTKTLIASFIWFFGYALHAQPSTPNTVTPTPTSSTPAKSPSAVTTLEVDSPEFNIKQANKTFDQINLRLSVENFNAEHIEAAITTLNKLIDGAKTSISVYQKKLDGLENLIKTGEVNKEDKTAPEPAKNQDKASADLVYLKQEQTNLNDKMAQCRLFIIRAQEAINTYQIALAKMKQQQVLTRGLPLSGLVQHLKEDKNTTVTLPSFIAVLDIFKTQFYAFGIAALGCLIATFMVIRKIKIKPFPQKLIRVRYVGYADGILLFLALMISCFYLYVSLSLTPNNMVWMTPLFGVLCAYMWTLTFINLIFKIKIVAAVFYWYALDYRFFKNLLIFLLNYYAISHIGASLAQAFPINDVLSQLIQIIFLSMVVLSIVGFVYYFCHTHRHIRFIQARKKLLQRGVVGLFFGCGILNILGYHQMAIHLMYGSITTAAILFATIILISGIQKLYLLCAYPSPVYPFILRSFGYKSDQTVIEFIVLKLTLQVIVGAIGIYFIGETWGYGAYYINATYSQILNGISFANFTFYPFRIVVGILIFCALYLFFRKLATKLSRHTQFEEEEQTQVAVASILIYIGFTVAMIAGLLISGIDFTGLAIVAGALSVGIGMGLQSIVNNFVSGVILLVERHIKSGDHIRLDTIEGTVKKIRIRSTLLVTSAREDVIIPNSDLITRSVVNFMYTDRYLSICCEVMVNYDNDPFLVKKLLLQAVAEHDEIIKSPRAKTSVLFQNFGTSGMVFQVWFLIKDGNKKFTVRSDVNFVIERLFREHDIKFALPQRDINIKLSEIPTKLIDN